MGFTPIAGLPMGTRCGDIDAGVMEYLMKKYDMDIDQMMNILNKQSGILGVSKTSSDFRDLEQAAADGNELAALALSHFWYNVKKLIGSYAAVMGGVDAVIFTAGVGENRPYDRCKMVEGLEFMGIKIDVEKNNVRGVELDVSAEDATVRVLLIPTNEELMIARDTAALVG
jgi:acetate kinase